ncbi:MAG: hypothetical protein ACREV5_23115, partial [Steroidobacter sp.]
MSKSISRLRVFARSAFACVLFAMAMPDVHSAEPHPAQALIDRAAVGVRNDPAASSRDAQAALELLTLRPDTDLEIEARTLLCDHLSERDRAAAEEQIRLARALLPKA